MSRSSAPHRVTYFSVLLLLLAQCAPASDSAPAPPPTSFVPSLGAFVPGTLTPLPPQPRSPNVVFVTLSGASAGQVDQYMNDGAMPTLARMATLGVKADYLQPPDPPAAAVAQMSLMTGASPGRTGIVADNFRKAGEAIGQSSSGFAVASNVEPVWRSAMRFGLRTALIGYGVGSLASPTQRADLTITTGAIVAPSAQHVLKFADAKDWKNAPASFSPLKEARSTIAMGSGVNPLELFVLALDSTNDQQENYDSWLLSLAKTVDESTVRLRVDEWATLITDPLLQSSASFKVTDANPAHFAVYQTAVTLNQVAPLDLAREITQHFGAPPPGGDLGALERNWIDEGTYLQMSERQANWLVAATLFVYRQYRPDFLGLQLGAIADAARALSLSEPRQPAFSAERARRFAAALRHGYELADAALNQLFVQLDFNASALLVISDHGFAPVHTVVHLNRWLAERKWLSVQRGANVVELAQSKAYAETSGGAAHIYINLKGRDPSSMVEPSDYEKLQADIVSALKDLTDPVDRQPIFARVLKKQELGSLGLQSDNAGDIFVQARRGFVLSAQRDRTLTLEPATVLGAGGYDANTPEMRGIFIAHGAGVQRETRLLPIRALDVAPTVASLLRFTPRTFIEGRVIDGALK